MALAVGAARGRTAVLLVLTLLGAFLLRWQVARGWTFCGADTYAYAGAASELREHHRYGFRLPLWYPNQPKETPPGYGRLPGYPLLLAALLDPPLRAYEPLFERAKLVQRGLDTLTCLMVFLCALRLGGPWAAWPALGLAALSPSLALFSAAVLTENLATFLTTLMLVLCVGAALERRAGRARAYLLAAGAVAGLNTLVRIDGMVVAPVLAAPVLARGAIRRRDVAAAVLCGLVVFSPWPARNWARFGAAHPLGRPCDIRGREIPHVSVFDWFATWVVREADTPQTLYCFFRDDCVSTMATYPAHAYDSPAERQRLERLLARRNREGLSAVVDQEFKALARERLRREPLRTLVTLPLRRAYHLWVSPNDQPLRATATLPWPAVMSRVRPALLWINLATLGLGLWGLVALAARARRRGAAGATAAVDAAAPVDRRLLAAAAVMGGALALRTGFLSLIGFVDNRYTLELWPMTMILAGVGLRELPRLGRRQAAPAGTDEGA